MTNARKKRPRPTEPAERAQRAATRPNPVYRRLHGYAFDPSLSSRLETADINELTYKVAWEGRGGDADGDAPLEPGPVGEYVEVIDYDPGSDCFYEPVDLDQPELLAQDGLQASEGNPQFHQQMVYAVAMTTIRNFERALGRRAQWAPQMLDAPKKGQRRARFVQHLRIYPHALREANAYYSPDKKALLFGYFPAGEDRPDRYLPGGVVFTALSHDIIAHETTHALLDGMHQRFIEANQPDALAFHEAFADIVALFQHFTFPEVLRHQIARTRGDLAQQSLLGELAQEFGEAIGNYGALRSAIGQVDPETGVWSPQKPSPDDYQNEMEPHARGAILVAAVFDAFLSIYKSRVADLLRIATSGSGVLPEGAIHPDLVNRLASEASKAAQHVLTMCVRALDYCPPFDIDFGDYLRAIITADIDIVPDDDLDYRVAFVDAFRRRGIYPRNVRTLSVESLTWNQVGESQDFFAPLADQLRSQADKFRYFRKRAKIYEETERIAAELNLWIRDEGFRDLREFSRVAGITFQFNLDGLRGDDGRVQPKGRSGVPRFQIHSLRPSRRVGPDGNALNQVIISIIQTREVPLDPKDPASEPMKFRGGTTLILDLDTVRLRYAITKRVDDDARLERQRGFRLGLLESGSPRATYFSSLRAVNEPFAFLHRDTSAGRP